MTLDEDTLPDGIELSAATKSEITIVARISGANGGLFPIGVQAKIEVPFSDRLVTALMSGIKFGLIVALAALGLSLIFGTTGLTNFAHGELITFGALATYVFNRNLGVPSSWRASWPWPCPRPSAGPRTAGSGDHCAAAAPG